MKSILKVLCLLSCLTFVSCEDKFKELDKGHDVFTLTAPKEAIVLEEVNYNAEAISLAWTTGTNYGTGNRIAYSLKFSIGNKVVVEEIEDGVFNWKKTVEEFNTWLMDELTVMYGDNVKINVEAIASVYGHEEMTQTQSAVISVKTYEPVTKNLYIKGSATVKGSDPIEISRVENGIFKSIVRLKAKDADDNTAGFKFVTSKSSDIPGYSRAGQDNSKLVYRTSASAADELFTVPEDGVYDIAINLFDLSISITKSDGIPERFEEVFFVGGFTSWQFMPMTHDLLRKNLWYYGSTLSGGDGSNEFKFTSETNWDSVNKIGASEKDASIENTEVLIGEPEDLKWKLTQEQVGKTWQIYLDVTDGKEKMMMREFYGYDGVWIVGNVTTAPAWDLPSCPAMSSVGNWTYEWTGPLKTGEIKFVLDSTKAYTKGRWFMAPVNGSIPTGSKERAMFIDMSDSFYAELYPDESLREIDRKWKIATEGTYKISLNVLTQEITFTLQQ